MKIQGLMNTNEIKTMRYQNEHNQSNLEWNNIENMLKASEICLRLFRSVWAKISDFCHSDISQ